MSRHLKTRIVSRLSCVISYYVPNSDVSASHTRGVRYFVPLDGAEFIWGAMNTVKEGRKYRKHIVIRPYSGHCKVMQLYTYHFPKTWSAACVANREIIKEAQRRAHALEHDHSIAALEWRIRFLNHYFKVFKGGARPEPGFKPYSRFYQYTYVAIYRELKARQQAALQSAQFVPNTAQNAAEQITQSLPPTADDVAFEPIINRVPAAVGVPAVVLRHAPSPSRSFHALSGRVSSEHTVASCCAYARKGYFFTKALPSCLVLAIRPFHAGMTVP